MPRRMNALQRARPSLFLLFAWLVGCTVGPPGLPTSSSHFLLRTTLDPRNAQALSRTAETYLDELSDRLGVRPPPGSLLRIHHFRWRLNFRRYMRGAYPSLRACKGACFETPEAYVVAVYGAPGGRNMTEILKHELTHYLLAVHFSYVPPWIDEGLARVFACGPPYPHLEGEFLERVKRTTRHSRQSTINRLLVLPPGHLVSLDQAYLSCAVTFYLLTHTEHPFHRLRSFLNTSGPDRAPGETFRACWGLTLTEACEKLAEWSRSDDSAT